LLIINFLVNSIFQVFHQPQEVYHKFKLLLILMLMVLSTLVREINQQENNKKLQFKALEVYQKNKLKEWLNKLNNLNNKMVKEDN
jgi:hypothetical protein